MPIDKILKPTSSYIDKFKKTEAAKSPSLFSDREYNFSYRLVILHTAYVYFKNGGVKNLSEILQLSLDVVDNKSSDGFSEKDLYSIYRYGDKNYGIVFIDSTNTCIPLIFFPDDDPDHQYRVSAFKHSLDDLYKDSGHYESIIRSNKAWDILVKEIVQKLPVVKEGDG